MQSHQQPPSARYLQKSLTWGGKQKVFTSSLFELKHLLKPYFIKYFSSTVWSQQWNMTQLTLEQFLQSTEDTCCNSAIPSHGSSSWCSYLAVSVPSAASSCRPNSCNISLPEGENISCLTFNILQYLSYAFPFVIPWISQAPETLIHSPHPVPSQSLGKILASPLYLENTEGKTLQQKTAPWREYFSRSSRVSAPAKGAKLRHIKSCRSLITWT